MTKKRKNSRNRRQCREDVDQLKMEEPSYGRRKEVGNRRMEREIPLLDKIDTAHSAKTHSNLHCTKKREDSKQNKWI